MSADRIDGAEGTRAPAAPAGAAGAGPERRVHPALVRPVLFAGVERPVVALEGAIAAGLVATVGPRLVTLVVVALIVGVVHPLMAWLTAREPMATALYARSLAWRDYYPPHGARRGAGRARPTLPRLG